VSNKKYTTGIKVIYPTLPFANSTTIPVSKEPDLLAAKRVDISEHSHYETRPFQFLLLLLVGVVGIVGVVVDLYVFAQIIVIIILKFNYFNNAAKQQPRQDGRTVDELTRSYRRRLRTGIAVACARGTATIMLMAGQALTFT